MIDIDLIRQSLTAPDGERLIALDWDKDIASLLQSGGEINFHTIEGDEIEEVMQQLLALPELNEATDVVFNLTVREEYCCKMWKMALLADSLCTIPSQPSIAWAYTKSPSQPVNIKINIIYK